MPERATIERAHHDAAQGKSPSTQAGEFVREEVHHIREGKHGARSTKQAIAIGLSKARRSGVKLRASKTSSARTRAQAKRDLAKGKRPKRKPSRTRARAVEGALAPRGQPRRDAQVAEPTSSRERATPKRVGTFRVRAAGGSHQGRAWTIGRREEGGAHSRPERAVSRRDRR